MLQSIKSRVNIQIIAAILFIISFYVGLIFTGNRYFGMKFVADTLYIDFVLYMVFAYIIYRVTKNVYAFILLFSLLLIIVVFANFLKIAFYGAPLFVDDIFLLQELFRILDGFYFVALLVVLVITAIGLLYAVNIKKLFAIDLMIIVLLLIGSIFFYPQFIVQFVKNQYNYIFWEQKVNFEKMGPLVYLYQVFARYQIDTVHAPDKEEVSNAMQNLSCSTSKQGSFDFHKRNVYIVLLESFWDASVLKDANLSQDCFVPSFRKLIEKKGKSYALSPVFGGKTANAEFEILCGQPVTFGKGVIFQTSVHNEVECLPKLLQEEGYDVSAWHPNSPSFFNRINAYKKIGFEHSFFKEKFKFKDKNGPFLADKELFQTVIAHNKKLDKPHLTYIMTITGHWGYPLNKKRKKLIKTTSNVKEVGNYVNSIYYTSKEFMEFYEMIRKNDPTALVVVAGDHLPFLGKNFAGYVESGFLRSSISDFTPSMYVDYVSTPLLILDGENGKVDVGRVSMYDIPHIILALLGYKKNHILERIKNNTGITIRAFDGLNLVLTKQHEIMKCTKNSTEEPCRQSNSWIQNINIISRDLFLGEQYSVQTND